SKSVSALKLAFRLLFGALAALVFATACAQLIGEYDIVANPDQTTGPIAPGVPEEICESGVTRCDGRLLQLCTDGGTGWVTLEPCATPELCNSNDAMTVSSCVRPACAEEQMSCESNLLRLCNPSRTGWEPFAECESEAH